MADPEYSHQGEPTNLVRTETHDRVGILTLNDPGRRNAISPALAEDIVVALDGLLAAVTDHGEAVRLELEQQLWSLDQEEFKERIAALKKRISGKR